MALDRPTDATTRATTRSFNEMEGQPRSARHDVDCNYSSLMSGQQIIDEITDNRVRFVAELRHHATYERAAARMPLEIDGTVRSVTVNLGPAMRTTRALVFRWDETEFLQPRIGHNFLRSEPRPVVMTWTTVCIVSP